MKKLRSLVFSVAIIGWFASSDRVERDSDHQQANGGISPGVPAPPSITYRMIAKSCGVAHTTVGRVLNGFPHVSAKKRELVLAAAAELGYRPDPLLSALSKRRWPNGPSSNTAVIAWLEYFDSAHAKIREELKGGHKRAEELGYILDVFNLKKQRSFKELSRVLESRGIRGIVVRGFTDTETLDIDFSKFFTVFVGPQNDAITVHNIQSDFRAGVRAGVALVRERGYRRPGFVLLNFRSSGTNEPIWAQALAEQRRFLEDFGPQPEIFCWQSADGNKSARRFFTWLKEEKPDVLVASHPNPWHWLNDPSAYGLTRTKRLLVPEDIPFISLRPQKPKIAGLAHFDLREALQGREALELVHRNLQMGRYGRPEVPMRILVPPIFIEGTSLPVSVIRTSA